MGPIGPLGPIAGPQSFMELAGQGFPPLPPPPIPLPGMNDSPLEFSTNKNQPPVVRETSDDSSDRRSDKNDNRRDRENRDSRDARDNNRRWYSIFIRLVRIVWKKMTSNNYSLVQFICLKSSYSLCIILPKVKGRSQRQTRQRSWQEGGEERPRSKGRSKSRREK